MKIFVRERTKSSEGQKLPRYRVVGVADGNLKIYAKRIRKCELKQIAAETGAEVVFLEREGKGAGDGSGGGKK